MSMQKLREQQAIDELDGIWDDLMCTLSKLVVAQHLDREVPFDVLAAYCRSYMPDPSALDELVKRIQDNSKHYMHPSKLK